MKFLNVVEGSWTNFAATLVHRIMLRLFMVDSVYFRDRAEMVQNRIGLLIPVPFRPDYTIFYNYPTSLKPYI